MIPASGYYHAALIASLSGTELTRDERAFYRDVRPCGMILFARNCAGPDQIRALVADVHNAVGTENILVLIDQEGGRVQRLRPPLGRTLPPASSYAGLYATNPERAVKLAHGVARLMADDLRALSINTNCTPVLDLPVPGSHDIIGDRAFGTTVSQVVALGGAVASGYLDGGVIPVIKHVPGHGRAMADSHLALPEVSTSHAELSATDFATFRALAHLPAAMTAHVVFQDIDPREPASTSTRVIGEVIRGEIGFGGLLMSDDLGMHALRGETVARARAVIAAGCDVALHCSGDLADMILAAGGVPTLTGPALTRFTAAIDATRTCVPFDRDAALADLALVLDPSAHVATDTIESV
jgi:beta-N-acetylhexosaminidase